MAHEISTCPGCARPTKTVAGRCPNCGAVKTGQAIPEPRYQGDSLWDDLDDWWPLLAATAAVVPIASILVAVFDNDVLVLGIAFVLLGPWAILNAFAGLGD